MGIKIPSARMVKVERLKVDKQNPNVMTKAQLNALKENIKRYGFLVPIITNKSYVIADSEQRLTAAKELGINSVPVISLQVDPTREGPYGAKPVILISKILKFVSNKEFIVLDLFGGSGSTLIACEQLDRICYMMEITPIYCDVIIQRWQNLTGKEAIKLPKNR